MLAMQNLSTFWYPGFFLSALRKSCRPLRACPRSLQILVRVASRSTLLLLARSSNFSPPSLNPCLRVSSPTYNPLCPFKHQTFIKTRSRQLFIDPTMLGSLICRRLRGFRNVAKPSLNNSGFHHFCCRVQIFYSTTPNQWPLNAMNFPLKLR